MTRLRVVLDTNVFISAVLFGGPPREVLGLAIGGAVECFVSAPLLDELVGFLQRPKFGFSAEESLRLVEEIHGICRVVEPGTRISRVGADPADNRALECAVEARADFLITGDAHLLEVGKFRKTRIVRPAEFLQQTGISSE